MQTIGWTSTRCCRPFLYFDLSSANDSDGAAARCEGNVVDTLDYSLVKQYTSVKLGHRKAYF
jgi:hypothetical protein